MSERIEFSCQQCGEYLGVPAFALGKRVECPNCHHISTLSADAAQQSPARPAGLSSVSFRQRVSACRALRLGARLFLANVSVYLVAFLIYAIVDSSGDILRASVTSGEGISIVLLPMGIVCALLSLFLTVGLTRMNLASARGAHAKIGMLFSGGPYYLRVLGAAILFWALVIIGLAFLIVPGIYVMLTYWPYKYFLVDTDCSVSESFRLARQYTVGHRWSFLRVAILSVLTYFVGILCLGVGVFVAMPIVSLMWAVAYLAITGQSMRVPEDRRLEAELSPAGVAVSM